MDMDEHSASAAASNHCKVCDSGELRRKELYRMSGMAVFIGYLLLVPSVIGMLWSSVLFLISVGNEATDVAVPGGDCPSPPLLRQWWEVLSAGCW